MNSSNKDTIYIDIDDEITSIIEKINNSPQKIIALVLPKRASMLQSIVNMKLLKKTAEDTNKQLVLITSEAGLLPLAGAVGLYVAKTLQSKPEIPPSPAAAFTADDAIENAGDVDIDPSKPIGELADLSSEGANDEETIEVDNQDDETQTTDSSEPAPKKKDRKLKVPNFNKFRTRLLLGVTALVLLAAGWYAAAFVLPAAHITVQTDTASIRRDIQFIARPNLENINLEQSLLPAKAEEVRKTDTEKAPATGQRDVGRKATGAVELRNCRQADGALTIPAGAGVSTGNLTYITNEAVTLPSSLFSGGGTCVTSTRSVNVTAQNPGTQYNISASRDFTVNGHAGVTGKNTSDISGGTSEIVKVIRQEDIDGAKAKLLERNSGAAITELKTKLTTAGLLPIEATLQTNEPTISSTPNVGESANEVTVTSTIAYNMLGIKEDDIKKLIEKHVKDEIDPSKQAILEHGIDTAVFRLLSHEARGDVRITFQTLVVAGPQLDADVLRREVRGKSKTETIEIIKNRPGIRDVAVDYSPFWVFSTPNRESKIVFTFVSLEETRNIDANDGR